MSSAEFPMRYYEHRVIPRPPEYDRVTVRGFDVLLDPTRVETWIRFECLDCGFSVSGHGMAVNEVFATSPCPEYEGFGWVVE